jgi:transcriptional regulator with XRE-family HTH domain
MNASLLGNRIRQAREQLGMSQDEFALLVKKDQRAISDYENGKRKLAATDLPLFANILNVSILYFYQDNLPTRDFDQQILAELNEIPPDVRQYAINLLRDFSAAIKHTSQQKN